VKPREDQTFRVSYNRAYRSPSVINNFLDILIARPASLAALGGPANYVLPIHAVGNANLNEQSLDSFEVGYSGLAMKRAIVSAAFYGKRLKAYLSCAEPGRALPPPPTPPVNWPLPAAFLNFIPGGLPGRFSYFNFGHYTQKGFELGVDSTVNRYLAVF